MRRALGLAALLVLALVPRWVVAGQSLYGDELSTHWLMADHGLWDGLVIIRERMEITPPLSFVFSGLSTLPADGVRWLRLPALVFGLLTIPVVLALGERTVGRRAGWLAGLLVALSPFAIFYGAEARAYALLILLSAATTLVALLALDTGRRRWWVLFGLGVAGVAFTHYTGVFVLAALYGWLFVTQPRARVPATVACVGAAALFAPWALTGLRADLASPDSGIVSALTPFTPRAVVRDVAHWVLGYPYVAIGQRALPGLPALVLLAAGLVAAAAGVAAGALRGRLPRRPPERVVLLVLLAAVTLAGEALVSALGTHQISVRNLAASFPALVLVLATALLAAGPRVRVAAVGLTVAAFAIGAVGMLDPELARPPYAAAAAFVDREARPADVVVDSTGFGGSTPGPLTPLDPLLRTRRSDVRLGSPATRTRQFALQDPIVSAEAAMADAVRLATARGGRILVVTPAAPATFQRSFERGLRDNGLPASWRLVRRQTRPGRIGAVETLVFARG